MGKTGGPLSKRVCTCPGCPVLVDAGARGGRCPDHQREARQALGPARTQGYGWPHQQARAQWQARMDSGERVRCARCDEPIAPGQPWHLDHTADRRGYLGPSHAHCNTSAAGKARWGNITPSQG